MRTLRENFFSLRTAWPADCNQWTRFAEQCRRDKERCIDLTVSNPTQCGFAGLMVEGAFPTLYRPQPLGLPETREAIAAYTRQHGGDVEVDQIWLAAGTSELYAQLMAMTADPGEQWLVPQPGYPLFEHIADYSGVRMKYYPLQYDGQWSIDLTGLQEALDANKDVRAVVVVSPHNPTGQVWSETERLAIIRMCREHGVALVVDEVFLDYPTSAEVCLPTAARHSDVLTFILSGLSKVVALPQGKLAWAIASGPGPAVREALRRAEWMADTFLTLSEPIQRAVPVLLAAAAPLQREIRERCRLNREKACQRLDGTPLTPYLPEAGWNLLLRFPATRSDEQWALQLMQQEQVLVQPGYWFDIGAALSSPHCNVSLLVPPDEFEAGLGRILQLVNRMESC